MILWHLPSSILLTKSTLSLLLPPSPTLHIPSLPPLCTSAKRGVTHFYACHHSIMCVMKRIVTCGITRRFVDEEGRAVKEAEDAQNPRAKHHSRHSHYDREEKEVDIKWNYAMQQRISLLHTYVSEVCTPMFLRFAS